jgi:hypothetical protein
MPFLPTVRTKPNQLSTVATARPVRVAYLVDTDDCPDELLDNIFLEAYSRWGGRRTLIVPAKPDGIDGRFAEWLGYYDADIIYSFVRLTDSAVATAHERYSPAHCVYHNPLRLNGEGKNYRVQLPFQGLRSLSVVPALLARSWGVGERLSNLRVIDQYFDRGQSHFIKENFGFLSDTYHGVIGRSFPELFSTLCLISQEAHADPRLGKDARSQYLTDEMTMLEELGKRGPLLTLSTASDFLAPYLVTGHTDWSDGLNLVVGDSLDDRLLFWNQHHRQEDVWVSAITGLRLPTSRTADLAFLDLLKKIIVNRGKPTSQGQPAVTLRSCSLALLELDHLRDKLRSQGFWSEIRVIQHVSHADCIPSFSDLHSVHYRYNISFPELRTRETVGFAGDHTPVPESSPWHMREAPPPVGLREGSWMLDLAIDRLDDHCKFSNARHSWVLPRRLRLDRAFKVDWQDDRDQSFGERCVRVSRFGRLSLPKSYGQRSLGITIPVDIDAFRTGLCTQLELHPFDRGKGQSLLGGKRYSYAEPSDKGRYLLAVLEHFETLPDAFAVLMNGYWRDVLLNLGAVPVEKNPSLRNEFITTLRRRLGRRAGDLTFTKCDELDRLAREAIRFGRKTGRAHRFVDYTTLHERWKNLVEEDLKSEEHLSDKDKDHYRDRRFLDRSIQLLCQQQILFQGREWQCRNCYNRNWISIDRMSRAMECEVCKQTSPAPVSGDWHFRANDFVLEAYREHGVEAVIWTLWRLWDSCRYSFYFAPSMWLWESYPESLGAGPDVEIDALAVVDGRLYLCEAKSSAGLDRKQVDQLCSGAAHIRPDVLVIACMDDLTSNMKAAQTELRTRLGPDIAVELMEFRAGEFENHSILPG